MIEHVIVERKSKDGLTEWMWRFWYDNRVLWLDFYGEFQRSTRRHGFQRTVHFSRIDTRGNTINESDIILPSDVKEEAVKKFCEGITVKRWDEKPAAKARTK